MAERMRYHARSKTPLVVLQDTREQFTPDFAPGIEVCTTHLAFGDYSAAGLSDVVALELKWSISDLAACVTAERERFETMLAGLARYPVRALIVAASIEELDAHRYVSRAAPKSILASTWAWAQDFGVPTVWAGDARGATDAITWWLQRAQAKRGGRAA